jgi:hypothetical protein
MRDGLHQLQQWQLKRDVEKKGRNEGISSAGSQRCTAVPQPFEFALKIHPAASSCNTQLVICCFFPADLPMSAWALVTTITGSFHGNEFCLSPHTNFTINFQAFRAGCNQKTSSICFTRGAARIQSWQQSMLRVFDIAVVI